MSNVTRYDKKKKWYRLKDVNLKINSGRLVAIMGVSGAGKSTLFDAILKRLKLDSGEIIIDGNELGHVPQFSVLRKGNTVQDVMEFYASKKLKGYTKQQKMQKIDSLLEKLNLSLFNIIIFSLIGILIFLNLNLANKYLLTDLFYFKNILIIIFTFGVFAYLCRFGIYEY